MIAERIPPNAIPIKHLMFAHPLIAEAVVRVLGVDASVAPSGDAITLDKDHHGAQWTRAGVLRWFWPPDDEAGAAGLRDTMPIQPPWTVAIDAWLAAVIQLLKLQEEELISIVGRHGSSLGPVKPVPPDALSLEDWKSGRVDFDTGTARLPDGSMLYALHILPLDEQDAAEPVGPAFASSIRKMRSEADMRNWLISLMKRYPNNKPTSKFALSMIIDKFEISGGEFRRAWDQACASVDPSIAAHWRSAGAIPKANRLPESTFEK